MRRLFVWGMLTALVLGLLIPSLAIAQTGTSGSETASEFGIPAGTPVPYFSSDGAELGTITVNSIMDPYEDYDPYYSPERGYRYALVDVTILNTSRRSIDIGNDLLRVVDSAGITVRQAYMSFDDPAVVDLTNLNAVGPGESITGVVVYSVFDGATIDTVYFTPTYEHAIMVFDQREGPVEIGMPVSVMNANGKEAAQVTVTSVVSPFTDYEVGAEPATGKIYLAAEITVTNTGRKLLSISSYEFQAIDSEGGLVEAINVYRPDPVVPDFSYIELQSGESQHGMLFFSIYQDVSLAKILYVGNSLFVIVADVDASSTMGVPTSAPPVATGTETAPVTDTVAVSSEACVGVVEWGNGTAARLGSALGLIDPLRMGESSAFEAAALHETADQLRTLGDEQSATDAPAIAAEANSLLVDHVFYALADVVDQMATAVEQNNAAALMASQMAFVQVLVDLDDDSATESAMEAIETACPAEIEQLEQIVG